MPVVRYSRAFGRHVECPEAVVAGATVREALDAYFAVHPAVRGYVLDEQGALRKHVTVFVEGTQVRDRRTLSDPVAQQAEVHVMQALSGG
jgi:molybdopterin synthase sulfur carrier subunit